MKRILLWLSCTLVVCSCTSKPPEQMEKPVKQSSTNTFLPNVARVLSPPASPPEVSATLARVFGNAVVPSSDARAFATGDFNGDGSADLAVLVRPRRTKLGTINDELANWTIQDANQFFTPPAGQRVVFRDKAKRPTAQGNQLLLAVVHGYGQEGWRDNRARQAYLVLHAGCAPLQSIPAHGHIENAPASIKLSDLIYEGSRRSEFLFWTGSQYAWGSITPNTSNLKRAGGRE